MLYWFRVWKKGGRVVGTQNVANAPPHMKRGMTTANKCHVVARDELDAFALATKWKVDNQ